MFLYNSENHKSELKIRFKNPQKVCNICITETRNIAEKYLKYPNRVLSIIKAESVLSKQSNRVTRISIKTLAGLLEEARKQILRFLRQRPKNS